MACNTSNIREMKYGRPQTVMFAPGNEQLNGTIITLGDTQEATSRDLDHVHEAQPIALDTTEVIGKFIVVAPEINEEQYRLINGQISKFKLKPSVTYSAYELNKYDRIEYTYSTDRFQGGVSTFTVGATVKINGQGKFEQAGDGAFRVVSVVDTHLPFVMAPNAAPNQPIGLLPAAGKKIKLEVVK